MTEQLKTALTILRRRQLEERIGLKKSSIHSRLDPNSKYFDPDFPKPIKLSSGSKSGAVGWKDFEVTAWISSRPEASRGIAVTGGQSK